MVGCDSAVTLVLAPETYAITEPVSIRLCVDGRCSVTDYQAGNQIPTMLMSVLAAEEGSDPTRFETEVIWPIAE